jgi:phosphoribosyl 1,2-cyclic phosphodiesterase
MVLQNEPIEAHILLSHLHIDHVMGLPAFAPLWREDARLHVWTAAHHEGERAFAITRPPFFTLDGAAPSLAPRFHVVHPGCAFEPAAGVRVRSFALSHAGESTGYRIEYGGRSLCYVTDHEHGEPETDARLIEVIRGADLLIYDATFTDTEFPARAGWGHSTWQQGIRLKEAAGVELVIFAHHEPRRTDRALDEMAEAAASASVNAAFARQGMVIAL